METCVYDDGEPVHAKGKCRRHYWRDYKRANVPLGTGRPPMDATVYKLRISYKGQSITKHYSDARVAQRWADEHAEAGTLLFFGKYNLEEQIV
jgi:hypothetical protein